MKDETQLQITQAARKELVRLLESSELDSPILGISYGAELIKNEDGTQEKTHEGWFISIFDENQFKDAEKTSYIQADGLCFVLVSSQMKEDLKHKKIDIGDSRIVVCDQ